MEKLSSTGHEFAIVISVLGLGPSGRPCVTVWRYRMLRMPHKAESHLNESSYLSSKKLWLVNLGMFSKWSKQKQIWRMILGGSKITFQPQAIWIKGTNCILLFPGRTCKVFSKEDCGVSAHKKWDTRQKYQSWQPNHFGTKLKMDTLKLDPMLVIPYINASQEYVGGSYWSSNADEYRCCKWWIFYHARNVPTRDKNTQRYIYDLMDL